MASAPWPRKGYRSTPDAHTSPIDHETARSPNLHHTNTHDPYEMSHPIPPSPLDRPSRSTTDPPTDFKPHPHHHHHRIHRPHRRDKSVPQSALLPSSTPNLFKDNSFADLLNPIAKVGSRVEGRGQGLGEEGVGGDGGGGGVGKRVVMLEENWEEGKRREREREGRERGVWREVERRRGGRGEGDEYLQTTLTSLSTLSTATTRRLDYTHYSLLSHLSSLCSTLSALAALGTSTSTHLQSFNHSTSDLARTTTTQLQQFEESKFAEQKTRAEGLEGRVKDARGKMQLVEKRLEGIGQQVENVEGADRERGKRRWWRWKCVWVACGGFIGVCVLVAMLRRGTWDGDAQTRDRTLLDGFRQEEGSEDGLLGREEMDTTVPMPKWRSETRNGGNKTEEVKGGWEARLRMLEEL
ncbi:MAG: hypothetical protein Q9186_005408 [Xanthomendoza sp. 1 TL-2023]